MRKGPPSLISVGALLAGFSWFSEMRMKDRLENLQTTTTDVFEFFPAIAPYSNALTAAGAATVLVGLLWLIWNNFFYSNRNAKMSNRDDQNEEKRGGFAGIKLRGVKMKNALIGLDLENTPVDAEDVTFEDVHRPIVARNTDRRE